MAYTLAELRSQRDALNKEITSKAKVLFHEEVKHLFVEHPDLKSFSWTQYTPYFNDGNTCEFGVNTSDPYIQFGDEDDREDYYGSDKKNPKDRAYNAVVNFLKGFREDEYEFMFGDHTEVVVTPEGVEADDYDHD